MMKRSKTLSALRTQMKSPDVPFVPSKAYAILGHGSENVKNTFIVPENVIIITKAQCGEATYTERFYFPSINKLFNSTKKTIYENPLEHMPQLINDFGSLMVYKPGDRCPDFGFQIDPSIDLEDWSRINPKNPLIYSKYGLVPLTGHNKPYETIPFNITMPIKEFIETLYGESIEPSAEDMKKQFEYKREFLLENENRNTTGKNYYKNYNTNTINTFFPPYDNPIRRFDMKFDFEASLSQFIFNKSYDFTAKKVRFDSVKRPGVYYHFICRQQSGKTENYYSYNESRMINTIKPSITSYLTAPPGAKNIIQQKVVEAEKRKQFLPGSKFNRPVLKSNLKDLPINNWNFIKDTLNPMTRRSKALSALRTQKKSADVPFVPSKAYAILAHGHEGTKMFTVPKNCIIIVKVLPGSAPTYTYANQLWDILFTAKNAPIYENPLCYISRIIDDFGSVMVYKPGDICPDFHYVFHPNESELGLVNGRVPEDDNGIKTLPTNQYGLVDIRNLPDFKFKSELVPITIPVGEFVKKFYDKSIIPNIHEFTDWLIHDDSSTFAPNMLLKDTINLKRDDLPSSTIFPFFPGSSRTNQSEILAVHPTTGEARRPGVYYNFVCRPYNGSRQNMIVWNPNLKKYTMKPNITSILKSNLPLASQTILKRRILEAEKRKHFLPGSKFNKPSATARRRKSRSQRRTRKTRK